MTALAMQQRSEKVNEFQRKTPLLVDRTFPGYDYFSGVCTRKNEYLGKFTFLFKAIMGFIANKFDNAK